MLPRNVTVSCYRIFLIILTLWSSASFADEFDHWSLHDPASTAAVNHQTMSQILKLVTIEEKKKDLIAYSRLAGRALEYVGAYVQYLESIPASTLNRDEQLAYWLNLHNISVMKLIAENRNGHKKVKKFRGTPVKPGDEWSLKRITVEGRKLSLQDIEQNILLRQWKNPTVIYGISYGVIGSPAFGTTAFKGTTVNQQLDDKAKTFINAPKTVVAKRSGVEISSLYEWHKSLLFGNDDEQVLDHLRSYASPRLRNKINVKPSISNHQFNWKSKAFIPRKAPSSQGAGVLQRGAGS